VINTVIFPLATYMDTMQR